MLRRIVLLAGALLALAGISTSVAYAAGPPASSSINTFITVHENVGQVSITCFHYVRAANGKLNYVACLHKNRFLTAYNKGKSLYVIIKPGFGLASSALEYQLFKNNQLVASDLEENWVPYQALLNMKCSDPVTGVMRTLHLTDAMIGLDDPKAPTV